MSPCSLQQARVLMLQGRLTGLATAGRGCSKRRYSSTSGEALQQKKRASHSGWSSVMVNTGSSRFMDPILDPDPGMCLSLPIALALQLQVGRGVVQGWAACGKQALVPCPPGCVGEM